MNPEEYTQLFRLSEEHWWFVGTRDILFASIPGAELRGEAILDVGCGSGSMMRRLEKTGPVFGIDTEEGALIHCRGLGFSRVCKGNAEALPFASNAFGLIVAADMLEHCDDDEKALGELFRVAAPRGKLLLSVPAYQALWSANDMALHHRRRYSRHDLVRKVEAAGFSVSRVTFFNTLLFVPVAFLRLTIGKLRKHSSTYHIRYHEDARLLNRLLLGVMRAEKALLDRCALPFGLSLLVLAAKE
jgi:SAM-dependent methyltransferase